MIFPFILYHTKWVDNFTGDIEGDSFALKIQATPWETCKEESWKVERRYARKKNKNHCSSFTIDVHVENIINDNFIDVLSHKIIASFFHWLLDDSKFW